MIVLSLFDGSSTCYGALEDAGISVTEYYASEIDEYAKLVSKKNHADIVQLGDITEWRTWDLDWGSIDLIIGGSPCQGFSFSGKQLAFEDPRSRLFFVYEEILNHVRTFNPRVLFLLENVRMKQESLAVITSRLGVEPIMVDAALVSAQSRKRYFWCNWPTTQPQDRGIALQDVLEDGACRGAAMRGRYIVDGVRQDHKMRTAGLTHQLIESRSDDKANTITTVQKDSLVELGRIRVGTADLGGHDIIERIYSAEGKAPTLPAASGGNQEGKVLSNEGARTGVDRAGNAVKWRPLSVLECERLQSLPDGFTLVLDAHGKQLVSNTQRRKILGNGMNKAVMAHLFSQIPRG